VPATRVQNRSPLRPLRGVGEGDDFFEAFCRVREALAEFHLLPCCYGASRNAFASGMVRDMGIGLRIYLLPAKPKGGFGPVVNIFDTGPEVEPVSVAEQVEFRRLWRQRQASCRTDNERNQT
jgi:hypothetical protein